MSTALTVLNGVRYDLRNYSDIDFDTTQMIVYLNRAITTLDYSLIAHNSDWTLNRGTVTLSADATTATVPTGALNIREVWVEQRRKENLDQMEVFYKAEFRSDGNGEFNYWCHYGDTIKVEVAPADDTTLTVYYDKASTAIADQTSTMPYQGRFDNLLREATVLLCESKKYKNPQQADAAYAAIFDRIVQQDTINRKFKKKNYRLDF